MLKPHHVMEDGGHGPAAGLGVTMGDGHAYLLVADANNLGQAVLAVINDGVVQAPKAGTRIESSKFNLQGLEKINDEVRPVLRATRGNRCHRGLLSQGFKAV